MGKIADTTRPWTMGQEQRRQMLAFDAELEAANEKVRRLEAQVLDLEKQVNPLQREVERLQKRLEQESAKAARAEKLASHKSEKAEGRISVHTLSNLDNEILRYIANVKPDDCTVEKMTRTLRSFDPYKDVSALKVEYQLGRLSDVGLVGQIISMDSRPSHWVLHKSGREYVVENGLDRP